MNLQQAIIEFKQHMLAENRSQKSIESYQRELNRLEEFLHKDYPVEKILSNQLDNFLNSELAQLRFDGGKRSPSSIAHTKAALNSFFKWLQNNGQIPHNPGIPPASDKCCLGRL